MTLLSLSLVLPAYPVFASTGAGGLPVELAPVNVEAPTLSHAVAIITDVITCTEGTWTGEAPITFAYRWQSDGVDMPQAVTAQHSVDVTDLGHVLTCTVTAANAHGEAEAVSNECTAIATLMRRRVRP